MTECGEKYGDRECLDRIGKDSCPGQIYDQCVSNTRATGKPSELIKNETYLDEKSMPMAL